MPRDTESLGSNGIGKGAPAVVGAAGFLDNPAPSDGDELVRLLHQIEANATVNASAEFNNMDQLSDFRGKQGEHDMVLSSSASSKMIKVVDSLENPTQLYLRINYRLWDMAVKVLTHNPLEASIWIQQQQSSSDSPKKLWNSRNLPLHLVCQQGPNPAPVLLVNKLLAAYPPAIQARNSDGDLPIHIACRNPAFRGLEGIPVLMTLAEAYPEGMEAKGGGGGGGQNGPTPWDILESLNASISPHGATISKMIQVKLGTNRPRPTRLRVKKHSSSNKSPSHAAQTELLQPEPLITREGSDIASELNRRRLLVLMDDEKTSDLSSLNKGTMALTPTFSGGNNSYVEVQESRDEQSHQDVPSLPGSTDKVPSSHGQEDSSDKGRWSNRSVSVVNDSRSEQLPSQQPNLLLLQEVELLKRKLEELREQNFSSQNDQREKEATIEALRKTVEQEREACREQTKAAEAQVATLQDQLMEAQEKILSKSKSEQELFQRVLHLESCVAERKSEVTALRSTIQELGSSKAVLQQALQRKKEKMSILQEELNVKEKELVGLIDQHEFTRTETNKLLEISEAVQNKATELQRLLEEKEKTVEEKEVQIRALTEARRASEKKIQELEEFNESLRSKNSNLADLLRHKQESFQSNLNSLENALRSQRSDNESLKQMLQEATSKCAAKDGEIENLSSARNECLAIGKKFEDLSTSHKRLQEECVRLRVEVERLSETLSEVEKESFEKDEIILEIERSNALLQKEVDTVRDNHFQLQRSHDDLTKRIIEEQISMGLQKASTKNQAYKAEIKRLSSVNAVETQKNAQSLKRIASLEEQLAAAESQGEEYAAECENLRQMIKLHKGQSDDLKKELNRMQSLYNSQVTKASDLENTINNLTEKNRDLSERCNELRSIFCARVEKIEASCTKPPDSPLSRLEIEPLLQTAMSDLQNLVDDLREKNQLLQEECDILRCQNASNPCSSRDSKDSVLDNITGIAALYEDLDEIRSKAFHLSRLLNGCLDINTMKLMVLLGGRETSGKATTEVGVLAGNAFDNFLQNSDNGREGAPVPHDMTESHASQLAPNDVPVENPELQQTQWNRIVRTQVAVEGAFASTIDTANDLVDQLDGLLGRLSMHEAHHFHDISHAVQSQGAAHQSFQPTGFVSDLIFTHCENLLALRQLRESNAALQLTHQIKESQFEMLLKETEEVNKSCQAEITALNHSLAELKREHEEVLGVQAVTQETLQSLEEIIDIRAMEVASFLSGMSEVYSNENGSFAGNGFQDFTGNGFQDFSEGLGASVRDLIEKSIMLERRVEELLNARANLEEELGSLKGVEKQMYDQVDNLKARVGEWREKAEDALSTNKVLLEKMERSECNVVEIQTQLDVSVAKNSDLQNQVEELVKNNEMLQRDRDELETSLKNSKDRLDSVEKVAANYEKSLRGLFDEIRRVCASSEPNSPIFKESDGSLIQYAQVAARQLDDIAKNRTRMEDEIKHLKKSTLDQNERLIMLKDQVDDWSSNAAELRSKNGELSEKLEKERCSGEECRKRLLDVVTKSAYLSDEKNCLEKIVLELQEESEKVQKDVENLRTWWKEAAGSLATVLGDQNLPLQPQDTQSTSTAAAGTSGDADAAATLVLSKTSVMGETMAALRDIRASLESDVTKMTETISAQESQIAALEETIRMVCDDEKGREKALRTQINSLSSENDRLRIETERHMKENAALEREAALLRAVHKNSKACIESLQQVSGETPSMSSLLTKIGFATGTLHNKAREETITNNENIKTLINNVVCLHLRLEEIENNRSFIKGFECTRKTIGNHFTESVPSGGASECLTPVEGRTMACAVDVKNVDRYAPEGMPTSSESGVTGALKLLDTPGIDQSKHVSDELAAANRALRLEYKMLKTAGRKKDAEAAKVHQMLRDENKSLKQSIKSLTQQTTEHQKRIHQLAKRQAELVRKKQSWTCCKCQAKNTAEIEGSESVAESEQVTSTPSVGSAKPTGRTESRNELPLS